MSSQVKNKENKVKSDINSHFRNTMTKHFEKKICKTIAESKF